MNRPVLVDTNVLIWLFDAQKNHNIGKKSQHMLRSSVVYISPVSITEIHVKYMIGKLKKITFSEEKLDQANMRILPYDIRHAHKITNFQSLARHDPFDRMLLAQALDEGMIFLTADRVLLNMSLDSVMDASV